MATTKAAKPNVDKVEKKEKPKKLSKTAEFWKKYPNGILTIVDMRAVMR
ncbi:MAG: hypothetical protein LBO74_01875 [Candidatus Symbiothrix sp.]|jgi:hypothetical protein|nr:hypothetical protein [Candidatus Symbiothrix sp.]